MSGAPMAGSFGKVWEALPGSSLERTQIQGIPEASRPQCPSCAALLGGKGFLRKLTTGKKWE